MTLLRAALVAWLAGRAFDPVPLGEPERWTLVAIAGSVLLLDMADGWAARRQRG